MAAGESISGGDNMAGVAVIMGSNIIIGVLCCAIYMYIRENGVGGDNGLKMKGGIKGVGVVIMASKTA